MILSTICLTVNNTLYMPRLYFVTSALYLLPLSFWVVAICDSMEPAIILSSISSLPFFPGRLPSSIHQDVPGSSSGPSIIIGITDSEANGPEAPPSWNSPGSGEESHIIIQHGTLLVLLMILGWWVSCGCCHCDWVITLTTYGTEPLNHVSQNILSNIISNTIIYLIQYYTHK